MTFWDWAVAAYARPGVAEACLNLQDRHGQNVSLLLWVVWAAHEARSPEVPAGAALAARWEAAAGAPLRTARRTLKASLPDMPDEAREGFRSKLKALELEGERTLMAALEALPPSPATSDDLLSLLQSAATAYGAPVGAAVFTSLLGRL